MGGIAWSEEEDNLLKRCVEQYGEGKWHRVPLLAAGKSYLFLWADSMKGLNRCRKSCRLRWLNYLRPNIKRGSFNAEEVELILKLHNLLGNRWSLIAGRLPGRTANDVKNYWNCHLSKKFRTQETDKKKQINITSETIDSMPLLVSSSLIIKPQNFKYGEGSIVKKQTMIMKEDKHALAIQNRVDSINHRERTIFLEEEPGTGNNISSLDLQYFEGARVLEDRKGTCSKWDWEDLILDIDLWSKSL